jgi:phenylalanine-4-hydroxylase
MQGYSTPVGPLKDNHVPPEKFTERNWKALGVVTGKRCCLEFVSGVEVFGTVNHIERRQGKTILISFSECTVKLGKHTLFEPGWGVFDMVVGSDVVSAWHGPADPIAFGWKYPAATTHTIKIEYTERERTLHKLYQEVRDNRKAKPDEGELLSILEVMESDFREDWLLPLEMFELARDRNLSLLERRAMETLERFINRKDGSSALVSEGLKLL